MQKIVQRVVIAGLLSPLTVVQSTVVFALPPADDVPEEILRTQIVLDARSPIDGKPMTPAEYAAFQAQQEAAMQPPATQLSPQVRGVVTALKLRRFVKRFLPFIPIR
jgi:hypothetical protein